jgi:ABC-type Fe3+-hydroxamate transport system substrate-binding protein
MIMQANFYQNMRSLQPHSAIRFSIISILAATFSVSIASVTFANSSTSVTSPVQSQIVAQRPSVITGTFVAAEAPTTGTARIVTEAGHHYLELGSAFSTTDQAPDLHVLLDPSNQPPASYSNFSGYVNLGKLQNVNGAQRYPIPDVVNVSDYKSVVIWCRTANATIGYAPLESGNVSVNSIGDSMTNVAMNRNPSRREQALTIVDNNS